MDADTQSQLHALKRASWDQTMDPTHLPLSLLRQITGNFSNGHEIGRGGFGAVYRGDLGNGTMVAVKKLFDVPVIPDEDFQREVDFLIGARHKNTVRLLGYCSDTHHILAPQDDGTSVWADVRNMLLCFELLHKGSLANYVKDESSGLPWSTRYEIIRGLCEGVHYLHQQRIIHMDLKPQNILLDDHMTPKITDFGLSKRFGENQSRHITKNIVGTLGYMAPEFLTGKLITFKTDIYSLGVIMMEMLMGCKRTHNYEEVVERWRNGFGTPDSHILLEQVEVCAEIAIQCMEDNPEKRPTSWEIILRIFYEEETSNWSARGADITSSIAQVSSFADKWLDKFKSMNLYPRSFLPKLVSALPRQGDPSTEVISYGLSTDTDLLGIHPLELRFPFEANKPISCALSLTNKADKCVFWRILPELPNSFLYQQNMAGILSPKTTCGVILTMVEQQERPLNTITLYVLMIVTSESTDKLYDLISSDRYMDNDDALNPLKRIEDLGAKMYLARVTALVCPQSEILTPKIIFTKKDVCVLGDAMDVHPTEPWFVIIDWRKVSIWNYQTKEVVMSFQSKDNQGWLKKMLLYDHLVLAIGRKQGNRGSVKFIPRKQWVVTGGLSGNICVYSYVTRKVVKKFSAYSMSSVRSLAVHPTYPLLISHAEPIQIGRGTSRFRLWDWELGWKCDQKINVGEARVRSTHLKFNPNDATTFAGGDEICHVWSLHSSEPRVTIRTAPERCGESVSDSDSVFSERHVCDYLYSDSHRQYLITAAEAGGLAVYDLDTVSCVHTLALQNESIHAVVCHPTLPVMVTASRHEDHQITCFWNTDNYRLLKRVRRTNKRYIKDFAFVRSTRLVILYADEIEVVEIDLEALARQP